MSAPVLHLTGLPTEILEHVLLHLPDQDIVEMEAVNRYFRSLIHNSPILQYHCELFAAGLVDNPSNPCDLIERRKLCEEYARKWSDAATVVKSTYKLPLDQSSGCYTALGKNTVVSDSAPNHGGLDFLYIPPAASGKPIIEWTIPSFPFDVLCIGVYHPENVLGVVERQELVHCIHLLNLRDGSPYCAPPCNVIVWTIPQGMPQIECGELAITASRIMLYLSHDAVVRNGTLRTMLVWDRKSGDLVFRLSAVGWPVGSRVFFLDEFRTMVPVSSKGFNPCKLIVFDTLVPRGHPRSPRRFGLPPEYRDASALIHADEERYLGALDRDVPFITDPTQAIIAMELSGPGYHVLLVVRTQVLIEHVCSRRTNAHVPWDEWGRSVVIMGISPTRPRPFIYVHGTHVAVLGTWSWDNPMKEYFVRTFDLGRRGFCVLSLRSEMICEDWSEDGKGLVFEVAGGGDVDLWGEVQSLGNGRFLKQVSHCDDSNFLHKTLHFWELT